MYLLKKDPSRADIPIVVVLYHREEHTRRMFEQLARVTKGYSLIIVNNGFDDPGFIESLNPLHYVENEENTGGIRGINQGLALAEGKYTAVLHNDILIYEDGWLDHIIGFLERRPDVGLVGLSGWHSVLENGSIAGNVLQVDREGWRPDQPVWRFTEVAAVDGTGWVARNGTAVPDIQYGDMINGLAVDISLGFRKMGLRVHSANIELASLSRPLPPAVEDDAGKIIREKWNGSLPVRIACVDEQKFLEETSGLYAERTRLADLSNELAERYRQLLMEQEQLRSEHEELKTLARGLEASIKAGEAEIEGGGMRVFGSSTAIAGKFIRKARSNGFASAVRQSVSYVRKRLDGS